MSTIERIKDYEALKAKVAEEKEKIAVRIGVDLKDPANAKRHVMVCADTACKSSGGMSVYDALMKSVKEADMEGEVEVVKAGCFGFCSLGPLVVIYPEETFYKQVHVSDAEDIILGHVKNNELVTRLCYEDPSGEMIEKKSDIPFYKGQVKIALRNLGMIDPDSLAEAIGTGAYTALGKVLTSMTPDDVVQELLDSRIRGRGGAGFPTGLKWQFAKNYEAEQKYVVCNADEGDPGAFMDRAILEGDPHSILEAMAIGAYTIGADQGYIYIRAEYPSAIKRLGEAIRDAEAAGLLGDNIMDSDFSFHIQLRLGAGAFVCGEETALIASIEGKRGEPISKPPFPAESGLWKMPTFVQNVETLANIPAIINKGADWFSSIGSEGSKGTKVFAMAGKIQNVGLIEVPMGKTLREIIFDIGGGIPDGGQFKAAQTGGPSGGCLPEHLLDTEIDFDNLVKAGSMMGSGGLVIMDETDCMVDIAKYFLDFTASESCGKCNPCRLGTTRMLEILTKITQGQGNEGDLIRLQRLCDSVSKGSLCALGQAAPNPVVSTMKFFIDEYDAHIKDKSCPAGSCEGLTGYFIDPEKCTGCTLCARKCPVSCISGAVRQPHVIQQEECIKCGACAEACNFDAVHRA